MTQDLTGGYCPKCDTVWAAPGICNCRIDKSKMSEEDKLYWSKYTPSVFETEIWNKAIEAAAKCVDQANRDGPYNAIVSAREIRKLKK